jgi:hypothetical protein
METFIAGAAGVEIFLASVILAVVLAVWAMRGMFWLMEGVGRGSSASDAVRAVAVRTAMVGGNLVLARVRASHGQMTLRTR